MNLVNVIATGLREIWSHKFRSVLTMLGIILGVSSLVAMSAMVKGMELGLKEALAAMGGLEKIRVESQLDLPMHQRHLQDRIVGVTMPDVEALRQSAPLVRAVTPNRQYPAVVGCFAPEVPPREPSRCTPAERMVLVSMTDSAPNKASLKAPINGSE